MELLFTSYLGVMAVMTLFAGNIGAKLEAAAMAKWGANKYGVLNYKLQNSVGYLHGLPAVK